MLANLRSAVINSLRQPFAAGLHTSIELRAQYTEVKECDGVREIILNEPKTRNALSMGMMESIIEGLTKDVDKDDLRCIVVSSTGPVWSAGHNLKELTKETGSDFHLKVFQKCTEVIMSIYKAPVPVIAKVNGLAAAAGCQFVASCDMVVCSSKSSFSTPGANFGIFCSTPGIAITRTMPRLKSAYMLMTGFPITAQDAYIAGLASVVVPEDQLDAEVEKITNSIKRNSRSVLKLGKQFYYKQLGMNVNDAYCHGSEVMRDNLRLADGEEGIKSFIEKRKPKWSHK